MSTAVSGWPRLTRGLFLVAIAMFLVTVVIGILNGLDLVDFNTPEMRNTLLTHVHAGTLGWITLAIVASAFWLAREADRAMAWAFGVLVPVYVAAFYSGNYQARAVTGTLLLLAILWVLVWAWRIFAARRSLPTLAVALGLTSFAYGAVIGVLLQIQGATGSQILPKGGDSIGAHAGTMVFSYVVLTAMGLIEWRLKGTSDLPKGGLVQVVGLFLGGLVLAAALLFVGQDAIQAVAGLYLLIELVAVVLFIARVWPAALRVDWGSWAPGRHVGAAAVFVAVAMAIFMYVVALFAQSGDPNSIPRGVLIASDHSVFVGVMTNLALGLMLTLAGNGTNRWPWAGQVIFWVVNVGLVLFLVGLITESPEIKRIGAPVMGIGILFGLAVIAARLWSSTLSGATEESSS
ncbi:MAG: hypothetical protein ACOYXS_02875 [Chloroflexota bacterium]